MNSEPVVIYHANCMDGFAAACVVACHLDGAGEYFPMQYGDEPPDVTGREVYMVDFSFDDLEAMEAMFLAAKKTTWIDHHATSAKKVPALMDIAGPKDNIVHDVTMCGAMLARYRLLPHLSPPPVLSYVEDRDLWKWRLPDSREVSAALALKWRPRMREPESWYSEFLTQPIEPLIPLGQTLLTAVDARCEAAMEKAEAVMIDGLNALMVNSTGDISEIGHRLLREPGCDVGIIYFRIEGGWVFSLRSAGTIDVAEIAERRGGGGHRNAAGFKSFQPAPEVGL